MNYMDLIVDQRKNSSVLSLGPVTDPTLPAMIEPLIASLNSAGVGIDSVLEAHLLTIRSGDFGLGVLPRNAA
jgi:hypothetical protein